jgi:hypothetical protein
MGVTESGEGRRKKKKEEEGRRKKEDFSFTFLLS